MEQMLSVKGYRWAGVSCGIKKDGLPDLALIVSDVPAAVAGVFTTNQVKAAPVLYDMDIVKKGQPVRAVVVNSGNANAVTGEKGLANVLAMAERAAQAVGCAPSEVLVLSTGVIGVQLPMEKVLSGIDQAAALLDGSSVEKAAAAIMTTDTRAKIAHVGEESGYTVTGIAKGSGMIAPNMATMLGVVVTDGSASPADLQSLLSQASEESFNRIVVDGDMSTNDTVLLLANGAAGVGITSPDAVTGVCRDLAKKIVLDGEGATKFVTVTVNGAPDEQSALSIARTIATSPLCKTAFFGCDPNWGRILAAAGRAGVPFNANTLDLWLQHDAQKVCLMENGHPADYEEKDASQIMQNEAFTITLELNLGQGSSTVWTCDLSHEYVTINADYRS